MLNKLWVYMLIFSILFGAITGRMNEINDAIFLSFKNTTEIIISMVGVMCFWCGMIKILKNTNIMEFLKKILKPFVYYFFDEDDESAKDSIIINILSDMLGIGNAATPAGIKAMEEMNKNCKDSNMTYNMNLFILMNTLSIQILPTTIMSIMTSAGCKNATKIIIPILITSILTFIIIMFLGKIILKRGDEGKFE